MNKRINQKGLSLLEVLVAIAILGGISLAVMQLLQGMFRSQGDVTSQADYLELKREVNFILSNPLDCSASLRGVTFRGSTINSSPPPVNNLELWSSKNNGERNTRRFYKNQDFGKIQIEEIFLKMPDHTLGTNWPASTGQTYKAELTIKGKKKNMGTSRDFPSIKTSINLNFNTASTGISSITSCSISTTSVQYTYPANCSITLGHSDVNILTPTKSVTLDLSSGGYAGLRLSGDVNGDDRLFISGNCNLPASASPVDKFLRNCSISIGHRDVTHLTINNSPTVSGTGNMSGSRGAFKFSGDVNSDDTLYFKLQCPVSSDPTLVEAERYVRKSCRLCMGHSDWNWPHPDAQICDKIKDLSDPSWAKLRFRGDVGWDDIIFIGFFCDDGYTPLVKNIAL